MVLLKINEGGYKAIPPLLCSICSHSVLLSLYCICLDYSVGGFQVCYCTASFQSRRKSQREDLNE